MADTSLRDSGESVVRDDAYYAEVRKSLGRGAPTLLLGASTKSLDRSIERLRGAQQPKADGKHGRYVLTMSVASSALAISESASPKQHYFIGKRIFSGVLYFLAGFSIVVGVSALTLALTGQSSLTNLSIIMAVTAVFPLITALLFRQERTAIREVTRAIVKEREGEREKASKSSPSSSGNQADA